MSDLELFQLPMEQDERDEIIGEWLRGMEADELEPSDGITSVDAGDTVLARVYVAFHPQVPHDERRQFVLAVGSHLATEFGG